jgi:hypothetical protein
MDLPLSDMPQYSSHSLVVTHPPCPERLEAQNPLPAEASATSQLELPSKERSPNTISFVPEEKALPSLLRSRSAQNTVDRKAVLPSSANVCAESKEGDLVAVLSSGESNATRSKPKSDHIEVLPCVDFSGTWKMSRVEGDMEQLMSDAGCGWVLRKMAKSIGYGVGKAFQEIRQDGNDFVVTHRNPVKNVEVSFRVGTGFQRMNGEDGHIAFASQRWDSNVLITDAKKQNGETLPSARRYLNGCDCMVIEYQTSKGAVVKNMFTKV